VQRIAKRSLHVDVSRRTAQVDIQFHQLRSKARADADEANLCAHQACPGDGTSQAVCRRLADDRYVAHVKQDETCIVFHDALQQIREKLCTKLGIEFPAHR
jgi:hypothetical protein